LRKITTYGLTFSNFGFMGLAVVPVVFPELALEYAIFTLPLWFMIYAWGAPALLISGSSIGEKVSIKQRAKAFINPMMIGMLIGLIIGLCGAGAYIPISLSNVLTAGKSCMAPIAMMLTGMTIAKINILDLLKKWRIYIIAVIKLLVYPLIFIALVVLSLEVAFLTIRCSYVLFALCVCQWDLMQLLFQRGMAKILLMRRGWR
jgi:predicted permease